MLRFSGVSLSWLPAELPGGSGPRAGALEESLALSERFGGGWRDGEEARVSREAAEAAQKLQEARRLERKLAMVRPSLLWGFFKGFFRVF